MGPWSLICALFFSWHMLKDGHIAQDGKYEDLLQAGTELNASRTKSIEATLRV